VQEWTSSLHIPYPYQADDGREDPDADGDRINRGGSYIYDEYNARCTTRVWNEPSYQTHEIGFRVAITDSTVLVESDQAKCGE
jgi:formylglycine-generating enzyme required for sulfatase activity